MDIEDLTVVGGHGGSDSSGIVIEDLRKGIWEWLISGNCPAPNWAWDRDKGMVTTHAHVGRSHVNHVRIIFKFISRALLHATRDGEC